LLKRKLDAEVLEMATTYPVVTIIGPRQSGKTTLVETLFPNMPYVTLEDADERALASADAKGFLARFPHGAILDEIQRQPELLSYIQGIVDKKKQKGMFILTGSHQLLLLESITQSLAGRTAILKLMPLSINELPNTFDKGMDIDELLYHGMYPRLHADPINPTKYYRNYVQTYVERDVRQMIQVKDLTLFQTFLKLCASRIGQIFNANSLSNELSVSYHTVQNWLSILEASFIVFRLEPYFENFGKRLIKSPKLYFTDVGMACYLLGISNAKQVSRDPLKGNLFENFVIMECIKAAYNNGQDAGCYYYRDSNQNEMDLLFKRGHELIPVEIKPSQTFHTQFMKGLYYFKDLVKERCPYGYLVYGGRKTQQIDIFNVISLEDIEKVVSTIFEE
jgi:predicted AAA+ superfamily ATPase